MHWGINHLPFSKTPLPLFRKFPPCICKPSKPPFLAIPPTYWFFENPPSKNWIFGWTPEILKSYILKGCFCYIFASLFCLSKKGHLWNKEKCFLFPFESCFRSWDNWILWWPISVTAKPKSQGKTKKPQQNKTPRQSKNHGNSK